MSANGWTTNGIAFSQIALTREDLLNVNAALLGQDTNKALESINAAINNLEAARRMIRGW